MDLIGDAFKNGQNECKYSKKIKKNYDIDSQDCLFEVSMYSVLYRQLEKMTDLNIFES